MDAGETITADGIGGPAALRVFAEVLAPACISIDHPRYFSFIPCAWPDSGEHAVRPRRERFLPLRGQLAGGGRRRLRRKPGAALAG